MDVTQPESSTPAAAATTEVAGETGDLVCPQTSSPPTSPAETVAELGCDHLSSDHIVPLIEKIAATPIAEFEKLMSELIEARNHLQAEGERIERETMRYTRLSRTASESVRIISDTVGEWRKAGHPVAPGEDERAGAPATEWR